MTLNFLNLAISAESDLAAFKWTATKFHQIVIACELNVSHKFMPVRYLKKVEYFFSNVPHIKCRWAYLHRNANIKSMTLRLPASVDETRNGRSWTICVNNSTAITHHNCVLIKFRFTYHTCWYIPGISNAILGHLLCAVQVAHLAIINLESDFMNGTNILIMRPWELRASYATYHTYAECMSVCALGEKGHLIQSKSFCFVLFAG